jgi:hypothetical protein
VIDPATIARVLDTTALVAYAGQLSTLVPATLAAAAEHGRTVGVPVACVAEAYQQVSADAALLLDLLCALPPVRVLDLAAADGPMVGGIARFAGRIGLAHACLVTLAERVPVMTADTAAARRVIGEDDLIWPV